ncbi:hypothetical protein Tco_1369916 [Tanacetum coccineum]
MMSFLKGQGYKNLQKLKYPQMKELYDKVQESIKDSFKDFIPIDSEKEKQMLQERDAKRLLKGKQVTQRGDRESQKQSLILQNLKVIDSPDEEYLMIYRAKSLISTFRHSYGDTSHHMDRQVSTYI